MIAGRDRPDLVIARAPLRVSFSGGGTDLPAYYEAHGGYVLSATISRYVYVTVREPADRSIRINSADYRLALRYESGMLPEVAEPLRHVKAALQIFSGNGLLERGVDLFASSEVPPGTGLGSSSALAVALVAALSAYLDQPLAPEQIAEHACQLELERLGMPIGKQDQYASACGGLNTLSFSYRGVDVEPLCLPAAIIEQLSARLLLFSTGRTRNSATILSHQQRATRDEAAVVGSLHQIKELALQMRVALEAGDLDRFGSLLDEAWQAKRRLSRRVTTAEIDGWYSVARRGGALGGKITGAGGGGFLLLYASPEHHETLRDELKRLGLRELPFDFDFAGAQVVTEQRRAALAG